MERVEQSFHAIRLLAYLCGPRPYWHCVNVEIFFFAGVRKWCINDIVNTFYKSAVICLCTNLWSDDAHAFAHEESGEVH